MRGEVILLVAGLAVVAALPVLKQVPPSPSDLLKIILSANPEENDLALTRDDKSSVVPTKVEEQPQPQDLQVESQSEPQNPPQTQPQLQDSSQPQPQDQSQEEPQPQDPPQEEPQPQDLPQEEPQPQDPPQEEPQPQDLPQEEPQPQDLPQEEPQPQDPPQEESQPQDLPEPQPHVQYPEIDSSEGPHVSEGEVPGKDSEPSVVEIRPEPPFIQVYPQENLSYESEELEQDEFNSDQQMETFPGETDEGYVVLEANEELLSLDTEGTFDYEQRMIPLPFNQEEEPFLPNPEEPQMEPVPYDSDEEELSFEPKMDSFPFEHEELPMDDVSVQSQEDSFPNDSGEFLGPSLVDSFPFIEEPLKSEYEEVPHEMEGLFRSDDYDSGSPMMGEQPDYDDGLNMREDPPHWGRDMPSVHDDAPVEGLYHESQDDSPVDLFSWLVPDYFDESLDYDEPPFITSYHDDMSEKDSFNGEPEMQSESQELDQIPYWEEPNFAAQTFDGTVSSDDSYLEDKHEVVDNENMEPITFEGTEEAADDVSFETEDGAGDVSFADFYIPINDDPAFTDILQEYPESSNAEDGGEELVPLNEEDSLNDGLFHVEPEMKTYLGDEEQDQPDTEMFGDILFPEYPPFKDERSSLLWPAENGNEDQTEYLGEDIPVTILESQPTYVADVEPEMNYPSLLDILKREIVREDQVEPWSGAKSIMMDATSNLDAEDDKISPLRRDYVSDSLENDAMNIIVFKDTRKNFDDFPITPMVDDYVNTHEPQEPVIKYAENQPTKPFWVPHGTSDQLFPKTYFSISDKLLRRKTPAFLDHMDEDMSFSRPLPRRSLKTPIMRNPFTLLNEVLDDDLPPQYLPSPSMSRRLEFMGPDTFSSPRNYPDAFKTPRFSFRELLQQLNPSFYDDTYMAKYNNYSPLYSSRSYNSMQQYDDLPHHFSYTSPPVPYSAPFKSFQEHDYSGVHNYYANGPRVFSSYTSNNTPLSLFREDTMSEMYPHQPVRQYNDYTDELPFIPADSFSSPRPRFPFYQRPQYSAKSPYSYNNFYGNGPYHPTPIYPRYAPDFY